MLRFLAPNRREFLRVGAAGVGLLGAASAGGGTRGDFPGFGRAKSVLVVLTGGGMSQLETWDPKPQAPPEVRGAFGSIPTRVPGLRFGEHMPGVAGVADRLTVLRTVSHEDLDHGSAGYLTLTGRYHARRSSNPPATADDLPTHAAVLHRVRPAAGLPFSAAHLNGPLLSPSEPGAGQDGGFLGRPAEPLLLGDVTRESPLSAGLAPRDELPAVRLAARRTLLESLEAHARATGHDRQSLDKDGLYRQAYELLAQPRWRDAFDTSREPAALLARYGDDRAARACVLARRLVERGVPWVTVFMNHSVRGQDSAPDSADAYGWDTHNDIFSAMKDHLLPRFDRAFPALIRDLDERGLLETTLVVCLGEFGRAPLVAKERGFAGTSPGRKHWSAAYSVAFAGAGVARGAVVGATDRHAAYPATTPVGPWDIQATLFAALGIDPAGHYDDATGRPHSISQGRPVAALWG